MTKSETLDCVAAKRRAQRTLAKALAGKTPEEQAEVLHRLAAKAPFWQELTRTRANRPSRAVRARARRRSTG